MGRFLAIDYGSKRTGVAITDPLKMFATPLTTVMTHELMSFLENYITGENVERLIVGRPVQEDNEPSRAMKYAEQFVNAFRKRFPGISVEWMDERYTSRMAEKIIVEAGLKKKERRKKEHIDRISAVLILQSYLDQQNNQAS